ncbi:MAG: SMP-30/gluconolactonase/LRE family protein [Bacteroidota bacterium]
MTENLSIAVKIQCTLGEGSIWDDRRNCLFWVDIYQGILHRLDPKTNQHDSRKIGGFIGSIVPSESEDLILLNNRSFISLDWETGSFHTIGEVEKDIEENRFNDGKCDPAGRFWAGTMPQPEDKASGGLYCLYPDMSVEKKLDNISISNGLVWTSDKKTFYYIDTPTKEVWAFDYDNATGNISNKRVAVSIPESEGFPDGMSIDTEDKLWIAHWGGYQVARWDPITGEKLYSVKMPVSQVTSCAFGGSDLDQLYITCARKGLSEKALEKEPLAGSLFVYDTQGKFKGVPANRFKRN